MEHIGSSVDKKFLNFEPQDLLQGLVLNFFLCFFPDSGDLENRLALHNGRENTAEFNLELCKAQAWHQEPLVFSHHFLRIR